MANKENTPDSILSKEGKANNNENILSLHKNKLVKTEPRLQTSKRVPLSAKNTNVVMTPLKKLEQIGKSVSAPSAIKARLPTKVVTNKQKRQRDDDCSVKNEYTKKIKQWNYSDDSIGARQIIIDLELDIEETFSNPLDLFRYLEENGCLNIRILKLFARYNQIFSLLMCRTWGASINEFGLREEKNTSFKKCTIPLYNGFENLQILDLSLISITDESLRYLIKLDNLKALGLSGTKISERGLKYLTKHAKFVNTLQCIKLCNLENLKKITDLVCFTALTEVDLLGSNIIKLSDLISDFIWEGLILRLVHLRTPESTRAYLQKHHVYFSQKRHTNLQMEIDEMNMNEIKLLLKDHKDYYPDIYLNLDITDLKTKLTEILKIRKREERLFSLDNK